MSVDGFIVNIEFKRVQEFLFSVPRLRNMVGSNVMLGEMIRATLPKIAQECGSFCDLNQNGVQELTTISPHDPLTSSQCPDDLKDDPSFMLERGILSRDGGHFRSVFKNKQNAELFREISEKTISDKLPGLRFEIAIQKNSENYQEGTARPESRASTRSLLDLPVFQVCTESGNGPANFYGKPDQVSGRPCSWRVELTRSKADDFRNGKTLDIVGLLRQSLPLSQLQHPKDFHELCSRDLGKRGSGDYLAVIYADGNDLGKRFNWWRQKEDFAHKSLFCQELVSEKFWHSCRVSMRRSLVDSLKITFQDYDGGKRPYQILMLGGDDLLLVCQAKYALRFSVELSKCLQQDELLLSDGRPLTVGIGIAIASPNYPFHALHGLAEGLCKSAKKLYKTLPQEGKVSVIDWLVCTSSWSENPDEFRMLNFMKKFRIDHHEETLALSSRPYIVLGDSVNSLEGLLNKAANIGGEGAGVEAGVARSQLRFFVPQLERGRCWSELCFEELPESCRKTLKGLHIGKLWEESGPDRWKTVLFDLVEISEIGHLATNRQEQGKRQ